MRTDPALELIIRLSAPDFLRLGKSCAIVSVNTQARRFGPLLYLLARVQEGTKTEALLASLPARDLETLKSNMRGHGRMSGELTKTKRKSSVRHYLDFGREVGLLAKQGAVYSLTAYGRLCVQVCRSASSTHLYPLTQSTLVLMLIFLLRVDLIGLQALARILVNGQSSLGDARESYQQTLVRLLLDLRKAPIDMRAKRNARDRLVSVQNWKNPVKYSEHLATARMYWLVELGIVEMSSSGSNHIFVPSVDHRHWLEALSTIGMPSSAALNRLVFQYRGQLASSSPTNATGSTCGNAVLCEALDSLFDLMSVGAGLQKVRADLAALFLMSVQYHVLESASDMTPDLLETNNGLVCGKWIYTHHRGSRSTQSYLIRQTNKRLL